MESVTGVKRKTESDKTTDWNLCILCQKYDRKKPLRRLTFDGQNRLIHSISERKKFRDYDRWDMLMRLDSSDLNCVEKSHDIVYHKDCYGTFTSSLHLDRLKRKFETFKKGSEPIINPMTEDNQPHSSLRSSLPALNTDLCIFCQSKTPEKTYLVAKLDVSSKIIACSEKDRIMRCRLAGYSDLVAADARYHLKCYVQFLRKHQGDRKVDEEATERQHAVQKVAENVLAGAQRGHIYTLSDVWEDYCSILSEAGIDAGPYKHHKTWFKEKLQHKLHGRLDFVPQLDQHQPQILFLAGSEKELVQTLLQSKNDDTKYSSKSSEDVKDRDRLIELYHTAIQIRQDIQAVSQLSDCTTVRGDDVEEMVPKTLFLFLNILLNGDDEIEEKKSTQTRVLSIAQDIIFSSSKGKKMTPKHIGLGMSIHQASRSKHLVNLLNSAGHCISYDQVRRLDTTLAQESLDRFHENEGTPIPSNIETGHFFQFSADNIDILEETLDGRGTFHATQLVAFQQRSHITKLPRKMALSQEKSLKNSEDLHKLENAPNTSSRPAPKPELPVLKNTKDEENSLLQDANVKDLAWILARIRDGSGKVVPSWTGFNQIVNKDGRDTTTVGYLPILNAPAHDKDTLWTVILRCLRISNILNPGQSTVLTLDEQLYCKAKELQWASPDLCKSLYLRLGGFHIAKTFMHAIGKHYMESGLQETWVESFVFAENTSANLMTATCYNRCIRAHKLTYEALSHMFWKQFAEWLKSKGIETVGLDALSNDVVQALESRIQEDIPTCVHKLEQGVRNSHILQQVEEFETTLSPTSQYWRQYMKMVSVLLDFIRAERTGNWKLHISAFTAMMPWFAIHDHTNYTRWGAVYLTDAHKLEHTHPDVFSQFMEGNFVVKTSHNSFNQISTDQALEHVNKIGKIAGGLVGITKTETARDRWCLSFNERSRIVDETCAMLEVRDTTDAEVSQKEVGSSRIKRDKEDVQKLIDQFLRFKLFNHEDPTILNLATCDVSSKEITDSLLTAESRGHAKFSQFIEERLYSNKIGFHERLELSRAPTMQSMYLMKGQEAKCKKDKSVKEDRALFQRLLVVKDAGRDVNLKDLLKHELSAVPLSLVDPVGNIHPTNKAVLGTILEKDISCDQLPNTDLKTCTIIDGQALVQAIGKPPKAKTFGDLADVFASTVFRGCQSERVDVVFDHYGQKSIKDVTRIKRSGQHKSIRRQIQDRDVPLPVDWKQFISLSANKADLTNFLSEQLMIAAEQLESGPVVCTSGGFLEITKAAHSQGCSVEELQANHEEADTRIILHAIAAQRDGCGRLVVWCRDTDVLALLVHYVPRIEAEIWFRTGTAQKRRFVGVHKISIDSTIRQILPAFHALTGCDTVSQFYGIGKKSAWKVLLSNAELLDGLGTAPLSDRVMSLVEAFVCKLYSAGTQENKVNNIRHQLFKKGTTDPAKLPPTQPCLQEHIKRAHFQSLIWYSSHLHLQNIPSPLGYGWYEDPISGSFQPEVLVKDPIPSVCLELVQCSCKNCNTSRCSCRSKQLMCTGACGCSSGMCYNPYTTHLDDADEE